MISTLGDYATGATVYIHFTTNAADGSAVAPSSAFEAADVILYKDGSATQRTSTSGWTMTSPFDSITGLHLLAIDLSDNTDAGFYAVGHEYTAVLSPDETVDGKTVVAVIARFSIKAAALTVQNIVDGVWDEARADHTDSGSFGEGVELADDVVANATLDGDALNDIADAVCDELLSGHTVSGSLGERIGRIPNAAAGAAGGLLIAGSNAATTFATFTSTGAFTITGAFVVSGGAAWTNSTTNGHGFVVTGNGTGAGFKRVGGATGPGTWDVGGSSAGPGHLVTTTLGDGWQIAPTGGHGINTQGDGTSKHGLLTTGGTAGTSDGFKAAAGVGGVPIRGSITGSIIGNITGTFTGNIVGTVSQVTLVDTVTTYTGNTPQTGDSFARIGAAGAGLTALGDTRLANLDAAVSSRMATYAQPAGFLAATFPSDPADQSLVIAATDAVMSRLGTPAVTVSADIAATKADTAAILDDTGTSGVVVAAGSKAGYALSATGLDLVVPADPSAIPVLGVANLPTWTAWFAAWSVNEVNSDSDSVNLRNSADNADLASYPISDNGAIFSSGEPT